MEVSAVCDNTVFPSYNNFMAVDYFCIKKCKIMDMGSTSKRKEGNHSVYLQSNGYPGVFHHFNFDEWCEIDGTNAMETVHVVSIDVQLSGSATIAFKDTETCRDVKNITLLNNNKYQIKKVFDLKNKFFISYKANTMGRFWIGFVSPQKLTITCGLTIGENCTVGHLPDDSSMSTESSALSSDILGTNSSPSPPWWIAVIVALLVGVVIAVVVYKRQKRKQKVSDENGNTDTDPGDIFVITPSERNLIPPSKTNIDIFIPEKRNNALPKLDDSAGNENLYTERKKKKKKRKKKTKHRNVDDENHSKQEDC
ncbi:uncharacterized protein LOC125674927 isoform X2 [Ostrea edulis]|nr:uncharacterized protein LOC125674927 isoform X2 [Ostrea edulis]